jgi:hypothetical protein
MSKHQLILKRMFALQSMFQMIEAFQKLAGGRRHVASRYKTLMLIDGYSAETN